MKFEQIMAMVDGKFGVVKTVDQCKNLVVNGYEFEVVDGEVKLKQMQIGDVIGKIDECVGTGQIIDFEENELIVIKDVGYRGDCCYEGYIFKNDKVFWLDLVCDCLVYEVIQC